MKDEKRKGFATKLGVIAATAGSAIGLGNVWRFPYQAGENGGGAYFLLYIFAVIILGIPIMLAEFYIGRASQKNAIGAFRKLTGGRRYDFIGYIGVVSSIVIMGFYVVVASWILEYIYASASNLLSELNSEDLKILFDHYVQSPYRAVFWVVLYLILNFGVTFCGVRNGIEKISNMLMPLLFILLILISIRTLTLSGAGEGLTFFLKPDFSKITIESGLNALGQAFWSLSIGMAILITYSSYYSKSTNLPKTSLIVSGLGIAMSTLAGIIIFPAVFTYNINPSQGPELVFITLPHIFNHIWGGYWLSIAFFLLLFIAALTSSISLSETITAYIHEEFHLQRNVATLILFCFMIGVSSFNALSLCDGFDLRIGEMSIFDASDTISSNVLLPISGILLSLFVGWKVKKEDLRKELTNGNSIKFSLFELFFFALRFIVPIGILLIFLYKIGLFNALL